jgi:hypothetical protein
MRYFTVKEGALVTRFGTGTYLAATVSMNVSGPRKGETDIKWSNEVVCLTDEDFRLYGREYEQLKGEGALVEVDQAAYDRYVEALHAATTAEAGQTEQQAAQAKLEAAKLEAARASEELKAMQARADKANADAEAAAKELAAATPKDKEETKPDASPAPIPAAAPAASATSTKSPRSKE